MITLLCLLFDQLMSEKSLACALCLSVSQPLNLKWTSVPVFTFLVQSKLARVITLSSFHIALILCIFRFLLRGLLSLLFRCDTCTAAYLVSRRASIRITRRSHRFFFLSSSSSSTLQSFGLCRRRLPYPCTRSISGVLAAFHSIVGSAVLFD